MSCLAKVLQVINSQHSNNNPKNLKFGVIEALGGLMDCVLTAYIVLYRYYNGVLSTH